jgi:hypothetical protein
VTKANWFFLITLGLVVSAFSAVLVWTPGYMDSDYYFATARELAAGRGFTEPFLWNYLDDPQGLPHPSHLYWLPMSSLLSAAFMSFLGSTFRAAQIPFLLAAASLPAFTAWVALRLTDSAKESLRAGMLAAFPGFFLPFFVSTDSFSIYALLGSGTILAISAARRPSSWLLVGILIGLASLTRADGLLFLPLALLGLKWRSKRFLRDALIIGFGVVVVMGPWWLRNVKSVGSPLGGGASRVFWLQTYDDLFAYPPDHLTFENWLDTGIGNLVSERVKSFGVITQRIVAENGIVFLGPFMAVGVWKHRGSHIMKLAMSYLAALLAIMVLLFPSVGARGAWFHSSVAMMPILWAAAPSGMTTAIQWIGKKRSWNLREAERVLGSAFIGLVIVLTIGLAAGRLISPGSGQSGWGASQLAYRDVAQRLSELDSQAKMVSVNNPPGWYIASGVPAVVHPNGDEDALRQVVKQYEVQWVILERNHPAGLAPLYGAPDSFPWLEHMETISLEQGGDILLLRVRAELEL